EGLLLLLDRGAQADLGLLLAVGAGLARAVQEEDARVLLVPLVVVGDEDDVLGLGAVGALVDLVDEAGLGGFAAAGLGQNQAHQRQRRALEWGHRSVLLRWAGLWLDDTTARGPTPGPSRASRPPGQLT